MVKLFGRTPLKFIQRTFFQQMSDQVNRSSTRPSILRFQRLDGVSHRFLGEKPVRDNQPCFSGSVHPDAQLSPCRTGLGCLKTFHWEHGCKRRQAAGQEIDSCLILWQRSNPPANSFQSRCACSNKNRNKNPAAFPFAMGVSFASSNHKSIELIIDNKTPYL